MQVIGSKGAMGEGSMAVPALVAADFLVDAVDAEEAFFDEGGGSAVRALVGDVFHADRAVQSANCVQVR